MFDGNFVLLVVPTRNKSEEVKLNNLFEVSVQPLIRLLGNVLKNLDFVDRPSSFN